MIKKGLVVAVILTMVIGITFMISTEKAEAKKKRRPIDYQLVYNYDMNQNQVKAKLKAGWSLGGVYPDCGAGFGEVEVTADVPGGLLPFYVKLAERNKDEILKLLRKTNTPSKSREILNKIIAEKAKLTDYGTLPEYGDLQKRFEKINSIIAEIKSSPAETGVVSVQKLVDELEKFLSSGTVSEVNSAKKAIQTLGMIIEKYPERVIESGKSVDDTLAELEKIRNSVQGSLKKADELGGGCRTAYVFYRGVH